VFADGLPLPQPDDCEGFPEPGEFITCLPQELPLYVEQAKEY
jgi:hypothetical protein